SIANSVLSHEVFDFPVRLIITNYANFTRGAYIQQSTPGTRGRLQGCNHWRRRAWNVYCLFPVCPCSQSRISSAARARKKCRLAHKQQEHRKGACAISL